MVIKQCIWNLLIFPFLAYRSTNENFAKWRESHTLQIPNKRWQSSPNNILLLVGSWHSNSKANFGILWPWCAKVANYFTTLITSQTGQVSRSNPAQWNNLFNCSPFRNCTQDVLSRTGIYMLYIYLYSFKHIISEAIRVCTTVWGVMITKILHHCHPTYQN